MPMSDPLGDLWGTMPSDSEAPELHPWPADAPIIAGPALDALTFIYRYSSGERPEPPGALPLGELEAPGAAEQRGQGWSAEFPGVAGVRVARQGAGWRVTVNLRAPLLWRGAGAARAAMEALELALGQPDSVHLSRVDIAADLLLRCRPDRLAPYAQGHRGSGGTRTSPTGSTLYVGSRRSPVMLRIYSRPKEAPPHMREVYKEAGVRPDAPATRVEFELKGPALGESRNSRWPVDVDIDGLWADATARLRILPQPTETYKRPSAATPHSLWRKLCAAPAKRPRESSEQCERALIDHRMRVAARAMAVFAETVGARTVREASLAVMDAMDTDPALRGIRDRFFGVARRREVLDE